jgi:hypothetical protein
MIYCKQLKLPTSSKQQISKIQKENNTMTEQIMSLDALQTFFAAKFRSEQFRVRQTNNVVTIEPVKQTAKIEDVAAGLRGLLADYPEMSVDKFLERKHADK